MKGAPDPFRSHEGGDFETLDRHLEHVRRSASRDRLRDRIGGGGRVPRLLRAGAAGGLAAPALPFRDGRRIVYPIRILGRGIPVSPARPMSVAVTAPAAFDAEEIASLTVLERGTPIASARARREGAHAHRLHGHGHDRLRARGRADRRGGIRRRGVVDEPAADLLPLPEPELVAAQSPARARSSAGDCWEWALPVEPFLLLAHPVAGATEPLGRRIHPYGFYPLGVALHAALGVCGGTPLAADIRWRQPMSGRARSAWRRGSPAWTTAR